MKKALKKVLSVAMAAAMAVGLMTMSASTAFADETDYSLTVKINFTKPAEWSSVSAKAAEGTNWDVIGGYDGESATAALTGEGDVYSISVTTTKQWGLHFIFNNGGWGNGQTANLDLNYDFAAGSYEYNLTNDDITTLSAKVTDTQKLTADDLAAYLASNDETPDTPATTDAPDATTAPSEDNEEATIAPESTIEADGNDAGEEEALTTEAPEEEPAADAPDDTPKTGDNALIFVAAGIALVAGTSVVVIKKKKVA